MRKQPRSGSLALCILTAILFVLAALGGIQPLPVTGATTSYSSLSYQMQVQFTYTAKYSSNGFTESVTTTSKYSFTATLDKSYGGGSSLGCSTYPCTSIQGTYTSNYAWSSNSGCPSTFGATGTYQLNMSAGWDAYSGNVTFTPLLTVKGETSPGVYAYCFFVGGSNELNSYIVYDVMYSCYSLQDPNTVTAASTRSCGNFPVQGGSRTLSAGPEASADWITSLTGSVQLSLLSSTTTSVSGSTSTTTTKTTASTTTTTAKVTTCPTMYLTEGLAPAAAKSYDDNVYITVYWGGQTPVSVEFGAFPDNPAITTDFAFNPVQMMSSSVTVLMDVYTANAPNGNYIINVAAQLTDPQSGQPCNAGIKAFVAVTSGSVFVGTPGNLQAEAIWVEGLSSPFLVSGQINASWYSQFVPTLDSNGYLSVLAFTLTGPAGAGPQQGVLTVPKVLVAPGFTPTVSIDGIQIPLDRFSQDSTNFYITYSATFSTHQLQLSFVAPGTNTTTTTSGSSTLSTATSNSSSVSRTTVVTGAIPGYFVEIGAAGVLLVVIIALVALVLRRGGKKQGRSGEGGGEPPRKPAPMSPAIPGPSVLVCKRCGTSNDPRDEFCVNCGSDLRGR